MEDIGPRSPEFKQTDIPVSKEQVGVMLADLHRIVVLYDVILERWTYPMAIVTESKS